MCINMMYKYLLIMPENKRFKLWCTEDMVRAIIVVRYGVPTLEVAESCIVPKTMIGRHMAIGHYIHHYHMITIVRLSLIMHIQNAQS